jgi:hypothetical protein
LPAGPFYGWSLNRLRRRSPCAISFPLRLASTSSRQEPRHCSSWYYCTCCIGAVLLLLLLLPCFPSLLRRVSTLQLLSPWRNHGGKAPTSRERLSSKTLLHIRLGNYTPSRYTRSLPSECSSSKSSGPGPGISPAIHSRHPAIASSHQLGLPSLSPFQAPPTLRSAVWEPQSCIFIPRSTSSSSWPVPPQ